MIRANVSAVGLSGRLVRACTRRDIHPWENSDIHTHLASCEGAKNVEPEVIRFDRLDQKKVKQKKQEKNLWMDDKKYKNDHADEERSSDLD